MGTHPSLQILHFNHSFRSVDLHYPRHFYSMDSSMKTMLNACTNKAFVFQNCNQYSLFQKLVSHNPKAPHFRLQNFYTTLACPKRRSFSHKRSFLGAQATYLCLYSAAASEFPSCLHLFSNNSEISSFFMRTHQNTSCPCLYSVHQYQCQWSKHFQASSKSWDIKNSLPYLRSDILSYFHLESPNYLHFSKNNPLASMFSSVISNSLFSFVSSHPFSSSSSPYSTEGRSFHMWHWLSGDGIGNEETKISADTKPVMTVVLLGWLGAQQKHLKKYAEWYNARGIHAVTFVVPMNNLLSFKPGERVEQHLAKLAQELASWISGKENDGRERHIMFHTFSNTGWLSYGVILEQLLMMGDYYKKIKGCVIDSAPEPEPNPQVWALGFSAALLKKRSPLLHSANEDAVENSEKIDANVIKPTEQTDPPFSEMALLAMLEKFFSFMLKLPYVQRRLGQVTSILSKHQPPCPQLYIYSSSDRVIPAESVESFIKEQKKAGKTVIAYNMQSSPHVDHFRTFPHIYTEQLCNFINVCTRVVIQ